MQKGTMHSTREEQSVAMQLNSSWLEPRQRILQRDGKRISIRLEEEFWEQLEFCAKDEGLKLADLVFKLIGDNSSVNRSSLLRTYCARWMRKKLVQSHLANTSADIQGILSSCPIPCVIVSREKRLIAQNSAFGERILGSLVSPDKWEDADTIIRFSLALPIDRIVGRLTGEGPYFVETNVAFSRGTAIVQMIGRFCLLTPRSADASPLLCFLDPQRKRG
jgi:predicted DNA-binding ribbon-helix-helix protein